MLFVCLVFFFCLFRHRQTWENVLSFRVVRMDPPVPLLYDTLEHNPLRCFAVHISSAKNKITSDRMMTERKLTYKYNNTTDTRTWILNIINSMYVYVCWRFLAWCLLRTGPRQVRDARTGSEGGAVSAVERRTTRPKHAGALAPPL